MPPGVAVFHHAVRVIDVFKTKIFFLIILNAVSCVKTYLGKTNTFTY